MNWRVRSSPPFDTLHIPIENILGQPGLDALVRFLAIKGKMYKPTKQIDLFTGIQASPLNILPK